MIRLALAAAAALALASPSAATTAQDHYVPHDTLIPKRCTAQAFRPFAKAAWPLDRWQRGNPFRKTIEAFRRRLKCSQGGHTSVIRHIWWRDRKRYGRYRVFRQLAPYPGGGTYWAIPWPVVLCESGTSGLWLAVNPSGAVGPYQLLGHGAPYPADTWHERMENHRIAGELWDGGAGAGNWVCAS